MTDLLHESKNTARENRRQAYQSLMCPAAIIYITEKLSDDREQADRRIKHSFFPASHEHNLQRYCFTPIPCASFSLCRTKKSRADPRIDAIRNQCSEADIGEEMVGHMDAVVAVEQHEDTGDDEAEHMLFSAPAFEYVRKHGQ